MKEPRKRFGILRFAVRWITRVVVVLVLLSAIVLAYFFSGAFYRHFVLFPREAGAWEAIRAARTPVALDDGWQEYRGICHSHSELSHDSEVPFPEILAAAKEADIQFICMSDHTNEGKADFSKGWKGDHDGVLFVRGFEMNYGFMPWGLPDDTILDNSAPAGQLAAKIEALGGVLFYAHSEEKRDWDLPQLAGMEIYNIHTNLKQKGGDGLTHMLPDIILSLKSYPDQVMRLIFTPQTAILNRWDELNRTRRIAGIAGNDCHQNNGVRGYYTERDSLLLRMTSDDDIAEFSLNALTRPLVAMFFGPLEPGRQLFRIDLDPYVRSIRFANTHVLLREPLSEPSLLDALKSGRSFVAFDMMADARGFAFMAQQGAETFVMGQTLPLEDGVVLKAESPSEVQFRLLRDGSPVKEEVGRVFTYSPTEPGNYRVEAHLKINDAWIPWVYTNPIRIMGNSSAHTANVS